jgi:hypothetical protein
MARMVSARPFGHLDDGPGKPRFHARWRKRVEAATCGQTV